ncbi:hypothetical protein OESDEN_18695, partial [Oesophagostomum dentatum]
MCRFAEDIPLLIKVMGGEKVESLSLDEPVSMRKLRIFYMEGIDDVPLIPPLSWDMRRTLRKAVGYFERKYDLIAHRIDLPLAKYAIEMFLVSMYVRGGPKMSEYMLCVEAVGYFERKYDLIAHRIDLPLAKYAIEMFLVSMYVRGGPKMSEYMLCVE